MMRIRRTENIWTGYRTGIVVLVASLCLELCAPVHAQESMEGESAIELASQVNEETPEEDGYLQDIDYLKRHPLNLNRAGREDLLRLPGVTDWQAQQLLLYRETFGDFLDILELQAVPGWDIGTIRQVLALVVVQSERRPLPLIRERLAKGEHMVLWRTAYQRERSFQGRWASGDEAHTGAAIALLARYQFRFRDLLTWGITLEKDAGEKFFPGKPIRGPDFLSVQLGIREIGAMRTLLVGDFQVNLGQGLIQWQGMAQRKSSSAMAVYRHAQGLRTYRGTDENRFFRGLATEWSWKKWGLIVFAAANRLDASVSTDSGSNGQEGYASIRWSGLHRTSAERAGRDIARQKSLGTSVSWTNRNWRISWNAVGFRFDRPLWAGGEPYQQFNISGQQWWNQSIHYRGNWGRVFLFGELAQAANGAVGFLQGLLLSPTKAADLALVIRHLPARYRAFQASAFTTTASPGNETGLYLSATLRPSAYWQMDAWVDMVRFPWLKYRVDAPSFRQDQLISLVWKPHKKLEWAQRAIWTNRMENYVDGSQNLALPIAQRQFQYRMQTTFHPSRYARFVQRIDWVSIRQPQGREAGAMVSIDCSLHPPRHPIAYTARVSWFDTDGYNSRIYQMERDVLFFNAIPAFYRQGVRLYIMGEWDIKRQWTVWIKLSTILYTDNQSVNTNSAAAGPERKQVIHIQVRKIFAENQRKAAK